MASNIVFNEEVLMSQSVIKYSNHFIKKNKCYVFVILSYCFYCDEWTCYTLFILGFEVLRDWR